MSALATAQTDANQSDWFAPNPEWSGAASAKLTDSDARLEATPDANGPIIYYTGKKAADSAHLRTNAYIGDCVVHLEFLAPTGSKAGVYLEGRYRIELGDKLGSVAAQDEPVTADANQDGIAALVNAAGEPGTWQTFDAKFRAPRFDDARNRTEDGLIIAVKINGKVVQSNTVVRGWSVGSEMAWLDAGGQTTFAVNHGALAIRNFSVLRADFNAVKVPDISGKSTNVAKLIDLVKLGETTFHGFGCVECHAVQRDDMSTKTGPNLFGLFTLEPRDRVVAKGTEGHRYTIKADHAYLVRSVRTPADELAIAEKGPTKGQAYLPAMPPFLPTVLSDQQIDAIGSYLATLNEVQNQGPIIRLVTEAGVENYDPIKDRLQMLVDRTVRIQRGPMETVSGRSIHVGLPNGINYTFDPRVLGIAKIWQGGFLDMSGEWLNRGGNGLKPGYQSSEINLGAAKVLLAPLNAKGQPIDFSFKEPIFHDDATIRASLYNLRDHLATLADVNAQFLGYSRDSRDPLATPIFNYRVGANTISVQTIFATDGSVQMLISGKFTSPQSFVLDEKVLGTVDVSNGSVKDGRWTLAAGSYQNAVAKGHIALAPKAWHSTPSNFNFRLQPLEVEPAHPTMLAGYSSETYLGPKDNYGRDQLFEALGLAVAKDGTIVVATRTAGIWRLVKGEWHLFAQGTFDSLGVVIEDDHGLQLVVGQKPELTRITDINGDGLADTFVTMSDSFSYNGNYHEYLHGPVRDAKGDYFYALNLADASQTAAMYRANGKYMGTSGGYRGWAIHVPAKGGFEPWADGMRSPASIGVAPDGQIWYADNQGEYVATSKLFRLKKGAFYGHPAGLVDRPGMIPTSPEISWETVADSREEAAVLFPESRLANSPGNPAWDTTGGRFGPYEGQMFIGDQTQSNLMRVVTETVGKHDQGVVIPFATDLESGIMRPVFLPDGSMLLGETGRGWQAKGGHVASLQRIVWDGKTIAPAIHHVSAVPGGFDIAFTTAVPASFTPADLAGVLSIKSWTYRDAPDYGSPELDEHAEPITHLELTADRTALRVTLAKTEQPKIHPHQTARVYQLSVDGKKLWNATNPSFEAFYTLYQFPAAAAHP
ncbi:MAG: family 16 glycoside hydrolase [Lacunisphaera sp.]